MLFALAAESAESTFDLRRQIWDEGVPALRGALEETGNTNVAAATGAAGLTARTSARPGTEEESVADALESALVRQGGRVLPLWAKEVEAEFSLGYDEPELNAHRKSVAAATTFRLGLPWRSQAELRIPYWARDEWSGLGSASGVGDITLGMTTELVREQPGLPALLGFAQWRLPTGDINATPAKGFGQHLVQVGLTTVKRADPLVLFGNLSYATALGEVGLGDQFRFDSGDIISGRAGVHLAATPDISLFTAVNVSANAGDSLNGALIPGSERWYGIVELGAASVLGRGSVLNVSAGVGFTAAAPDFTLTISMPFRF